MWLVLIPACRPSSRTLCEQRDDLTLVRRFKDANNTAGGGESFRPHFDFTIWINQQPQ